MASAHDRLGARVGRRDRSIASSIAIECAATSWISAVGNHAAARALQRGVAPLSTANLSPAMLQRAPAAAFAALPPRPPGTPIPINQQGKWLKPPWLRGRVGAAMTMRDEYLSTRRPVMEYEGQKFYRCPLCAKLADRNAMAVDHAVDWEVYCAGARDLQELEAKFHDLENLHTAHNNCNSSKSTKDLFDWWMSEAPSNYVQSPEHHNLLKWGVGQIFDNLGVDWLYELPPAVRLNTVRALVDAAAKPPSANVFAHMTAASKFQSAIGGGQGAPPGPSGGSSDDDDPMSS